VQEADLTVFGYYRDPFAAKLIQLRSGLQRAWCFWGERMGVTRAPWAGELYRRWKMHALHRDPAAIWGIGEFALARYRQEFGGNRVYCNVPYFSDLTRFSQIAKHTAPSLTFLYSGSFIHRKGVDLLAHAFVALAREYSSIRLKLVGDGELRSHLERILKPVFNRVEFTGFSDWNELPGHYASANVLCVPSRHDGWGLVVPEGLATGLPVIASDRTGAAIDLVQHARNGWIVCAGKHSSLLDAMREAASLSEKQLNLMSKAAVETANSHSLEQGVRRFCSAVRGSLVAWN
jgi:glycosyltransferase involved in cell wall biosynthesis